MTFMDIMNLGMRVSFYTTLGCDDVEDMIIFLDGDFHYITGDFTIYINEQKDSHHTILLPESKHTSDEHYIHIRRKYRENVDSWFASIGGKTDKDTIHMILDRVTLNPRLTYNEKLEVAAISQMEML